MGIPKEMEGELLNNEYFSIQIGQAFLCFEEMSCFAIHFPIHQAGKEMIMVLIGTYEEQKQQHKIVK